MTGTPAYPIISNISGFGRRAVNHAIHVVVEWGIGHSLAKQSARLATLLFCVPILLGATVYRPSETQLAFLSNSEKDRQPAVETPMLPLQTDANPFDGRWIFIGAGCRGAGSVSAVIKGGKVIVRGGGGNVTPDGIIHTVGAGNGLTLTAEGHLSGDSGSGIYDQSDGCSGLHRKFASEVAAISCELRNRSSSHA